MRTWSAARRGFLKWAALALCAAPGLAGAASPAPTTSISPDQRPTLLIVAAPTALTIVHHPHPMPVEEAEQLVLQLGMSAAMPIIRRHARGGRDPLPRAWRTDEPDRGFAADVADALDPGQQSNWPWRALKIVSSSDDAHAALAQLEGRDAAIVTFHCELEDHLSTVQLLARANVTMIRASGTPSESRTRFSILHYARPITADWSKPKQSAAPFRADGLLDQEVDEAALDLSHALAVTIARLTTPAAPNLQTVKRRFGDLAHKPHCAPCRPSDPVLHQEPGRVWVAPAQLGGDVLSLPVG
jgi:hypothetical protein